MHAAFAQQMRREVIGAFEQRQRGEGDFHLPLAIAITGHFDRLAKVGAGTADSLAVHGVEGHGDHWSGQGGVRGKINLCGKRAAAAVGGELFAFDAVAAHPHGAYPRKAGRDGGWRRGSAVHRRGVGGTFERGLVGHNHFARVAQGADLAAL